MGKKIIAQPGDKFGQFTFVCEVEPKRYGKKNQPFTTWRVICGCGKETELLASNVRNGTCKGCIECSRKRGASPRRLKIPEGHMFGDLAVIREVEPRIYKSGQVTRQFLVKCSCGTEVKKTLAGLSSGESSHCGCKKGERLSKAQITHGETTEGIQSTEYQAYASMRARCLNQNNPAFYLYGGRGIKICDSWLESFDNFLRDMGRRPTQHHSLDRIDGDGDYEPSNVRWATATTQSRNRHNSRYWFVDGVRYESSSEAAAAHGVSDTTIMQWCGRSKHQLAKEKCWTELRYPPKDEAA